MSHNTSEKDFKKNQRASGLQPADERWPHLTHFSLSYGLWSHGRHSFVLGGHKSLTPRSRSAASLIPGSSPARHPSSRFGRIHRLHQSSQHNEAEETKSIHGTKVVNHHERNNNRIQRWGGQDMQFIAASKALRQDILLWFTCLLSLAVTVMFKNSWMKCPLFKLYTCREGLLYLPLNSCN